MQTSILSNLRVRKKVVNYYVRHYQIFFSSIFITISGLTPSPSSSHSLLSPFRWYIRNS